MGRIRENIIEIRERETMINIKELVEEVLSRHFDDLNTKTTRNQITREISILLNDLSVRRFVRDYKVTCNEINNSTEIIDKCWIVVDVMITSEYLNIRRLRTVMLTKGGIDQKIKGKQIFSDIDPYGEENWEE